MSKLWHTYRNSRNQPPGKVETIVWGRTFHFVHIHEGMFTQLMSMVRQIPGVQPEVFWNSGLWVSKKCEGGKQDLLITEQPEESIDMFMRTTFSSTTAESCYYSHSLGPNLGAHVLMWLNRFFQVNNLSAEQSFPCPHCLKNSIIREANELYFQKGEVLNAALHRESHFKCPRGDKMDPDALMKLTEIYPELSCLTIGTTSTDSVSDGSSILIYEGEKVQDALEAILPVISFLREIPQHRHVVTYTGARLRDETKLWVESEPDCVTCTLNTLLSSTMDSSLKMDAFGSHLFRNQEPDLGQRLGSLGAKYRKNIRQAPTNPKTTPAPTTHFQHLPPQPQPEPEPADMIPKLTVEPQRVGIVAAVKTGCTIVPMFTGAETVTPEWAKQVMTSC
ncbi:hypothetical protein Pelo_516 [Pelomyxa schiedti]|nr:hypothetical protein Pelo_516 [Pelomyxa schiedti]